MKTKSKTLTLTLKRKWFELIKSGVKLEEYREISEFWRKRLVDEISLVREFNTTDDSNMTCGELVEKHTRNFDTLVFTLGYPKAEDTERRLIFKNPKIRTDTGNPDWGAESGKVYFVITWEK